MKRGNRRRQDLSVERLFNSTKGSLLVLLCGGRHTVTELAAHIGLTENAVRAQLERLQRDGLARRAGSRRGVRRPHAEYELAPRARELFPRCYEPVLGELVDVLAERLSVRAFEEFLRETGRRLLATLAGGPPRGRNADERLADLVGKLNGSGIGIRVEQRDAKTTVSACSCPLASVTAKHPALCAVLATTLGEFLSGEVVEACDRNGLPRCRLELWHEDAQ